MSEFTTEKLLVLLDHIKQAIVTEKLPLERQEDIWSTLTWKYDDPDNKEMIKYVFTGWWIHYNLELQKNSQPLLDSDSDTEDPSL